MTAPDQSPPSRARRRVIALCAAAMAVELLYWFVVTAGTFTHWHFYDVFLNDLAEGLRQGHLHLAVEPPAALLARPNPFDPANRDLWYWDVSLHHGHYYLYWGPTPAFLLAGVKTLFRISGRVGDEVVVFALATLQLMAGTLFVERAGRRLFARTPLALEVAAVLALGLANPTAYNLARASVYEAAIVGGQAFLLLGLVFAFGAIVDAGGAPDLRPRSLAAAGASWAAALGCRASLGPAIALLLLATVVAAVAQKPDRGRRLARASAWLGIPVVIGLGALLAYNRLRFDAWFDFGRTHQLNWIDFRSGAAFIRPNLYAYLRRPPNWSCRFPFAYAVIDFGIRAFPPGTVLPPGYFVYEEVAGVLPTLPWSWFSAVALVAAARSLWRTRTLSPFCWAVGATAIVAVVTLLPCLVFSTATNRYLGDVVGGVVLLGTLGVFAAAEVLRQRPRVRTLVGALALLLAAATAGTGLAFGFRGQYFHFETNNMPLYQKLVRHLSVCHGEIPPAPK